MAKKPSHTRPRKKGSKVTFTPLAGRWLACNVPGCGIRVKQGKTQGHRNFHQQSSMHAKPVEAPRANRDMPRAHINDFGYVRCPHCDLAYYAGDADRGDAPRRCRYCSRQFITYR